jgi:hypothetical protein
LPICLVFRGSKGNEKALASLPRISRPRQTINSPKPCPAKSNSTPWKRLTDGV